VSKRYFIANVKETPDLFGPLRQADLPTLPEGTRTAGVVGAASWCLVVVDLPDDNFRVVLNHAGIDPLPDMPLGIKVDAMGNQSRNSLTATFTKRGIPFTLAQAGDDYASVIRGIGLINDPNFDEQNV
jgi:hypothetical protein